jgi:alkylation response protein AidB-like acyl-CoA dehydrogenase
MNFDWTEDQRLLVETAAAFAKKESPVGRARALREDPIGFERAMWRKMGEFGWLGVAFPESAGGLGQTFVEAALILEQLGTTLVPEPLIPSLCAGTVLARAGSPAQQARFLLPMIEGRAVLALAFSEEESRFDPLGGSTHAEPAGDGRWRLDGRKRWVLAGHTADHIVVAAQAPTGPTLFVLDHDTPGLGIQSVRTIDGRRAAMLTFDGAVVEADRLLGAPGGGAAALEEALDVGAAACCAEGVGIVRTVLAMTTDYLKTREQFGVKIGSFQSLQHRAVDMFVETELCRSMNLLAAIKIGDPDPVERKSAVSAAKVQLAVGGRLVTQQAIQLHGGIGITDEHDIGLYFKRMHALTTLFGDEEWHVTRFAALPTFEAGLAGG